MNGSRFILPMRIGGIVMDMPLTRYAVADRLPPDRTVCYAERTAGRLVVAIYRGGRWLNGKERPLGFIPTAWFRIGGGE